VWRSVRIHLDDVEGQGRFIEFEAVAPPDSNLAPEHELIAQLRTRLAVPEHSLIAEGYANLRPAGDATVSSDGASTVAPAA
jgi:adenylate cyclase class IV